MYPLFRPHLKQRLTALVENLGVFLLLAITESFAMLFLKRDTKLCVLFDCGFAASLPRNDIYSK